MLYKILSFYFLIFDRLIRSIYFLKTIKVKRNFSEDDNYYGSCVRKDILEYFFGKYGGNWKFIKF